MTGPALDLDAALRRLGGDEQLLRTIVEFCFEDAPALLTRLHAGVEQSDAVAVEIAAHAAHSLASNFGAERAAVAANRLLELALARDWPATQAAVDDLKQELTLLLEALSPYRPELTRQ